MQPAMIIPYYVAWHYSRGVHDVLVRFKDFLWFFWNLFSITELTKTFFEPFERLGQAAPKGFKPEKMLEAFATTLVMRVVGVVVRTTVILLGLLVQLTVVVICIGFLIVWILLPFLLIGLLSVGIIALFS
jgi:hypothetical protein